MPSRKTTKAAPAAAARMSSIPKDLIDQFVTGPMSAGTASASTKPIRCKASPRSMTSKPACWPPSS